MAADNIEPLESVWAEMKRRTLPVYPVEDTRGPKVYEVSEDPSCNGSLPEIYQTDTIKPESEELDDNDDKY